jgi:hypothetical protein
MTATDHINQQAVASYVREAIWPGNKMLPKSLVGNVGNMLATCPADTSMSANFPDIPFFADILSCQFGHFRAF